MRTITSFVVVALSAAFIQSASAGVISSANAFIELTINDFLVDGVSAPKPVDFTVELFNPFQDLDIDGEGIGNASASSSIDATATAPPLENIGDFVRLSVSAGADAAAPPDSFGEAEALALVDIDMINDTADPVTVVFDLAYDFFAEVTFDDALFDDGFAFAEVSLLTVESAQVDILEEAESDSLLGGGLDGDSIVTSIEVTVAPGEFEILAADVVSFSFAESTFVEPIPEPTTLALMTLGLAGLGYSRRKRH